MSRRARRRAIWAVAAIVALNVALAAIAASTRGPSGPPSSSYSTSPGGFGAWAELLQRAGHPVRRLRRAPGPGSLDPATTVVVLDPDAVAPREARALARFLRSGGHLIAGGSGPDWYRVLLPRPPAPDGGALRTATVLAPAPETAGVERVDAGAAVTWTHPGPALPTLGRGGDALALLSVHGRGRLVLLSDSRPLTNRRLGAADNAALALALAGGRGRQVVFAEGYHGFGGERGLAALPRRWQWALALLAASGVIWVVAHLRRLGPSAEAERDLPPPRRAYVDALAATLSRTHDPAEAAAPVQAAARSVIARRTALAPDADQDDLRVAARHLGLRPEEADALIDRADDDAGVIAAGRALARLGSGGGPR